MMFLCMDYPPLGSAFLIAMHEKSVPQNESNFGSGTLNLRLNRSVAFAREAACRATAWKPRADAAASLRRATPQRGCA